MKRKQTKIILLMVLTAFVLTIVIVKGKLSVGNTEDSLSVNSISCSSPIAFEERVAVLTDEGVPLTDSVPCNGEGRYLPTEKDVYYLTKEDEESVIQEYYVHVPDVINEETSILLFMHGIGQRGCTISELFEAYGFLGMIDSGAVSCNSIIVAPILASGRWYGTLNDLENELYSLAYRYGVDIGNIYISGFSLGCDSITDIVQSSEINFKGAIYIAGHISAYQDNGGFNLMQLWSGKTIYYIVDNLYPEGGYGFNAEFNENCMSVAAELGTEFNIIYSNWEHKTEMCDFVFLPTGYLDEKGQNCLGMLDIL